MPKLDKSAILARLLEAVESGVSQKSISEASGITRCTISRALSLGWISDDNLQRLADYFKTMPQAEPIDDDADFDERLVDARCIIWDSVSRGKSVTEAAKIAGISLAEATAIASECPEKWLAPWLKVSHTREWEEQ